MSGFGPVNDFEYYPTPSWTVDRLLEAVDLPGGVWYEPSAGNGNIIKAVNAIRNDVIWHATEIQDKFKEPLCKLIDPNNVHMGNFLEARPNIKPDVIIGNPPYASVGEFVTMSMSMAPTVVMLLRLTFMASDKRVSFLRRNTPDVYVIPNRPCFGPGVSDSTEYAWYVWHKGRRNVGTFQVLEDTSAIERRASESHIFDL